jgi:TonB family protein
MVGEESMILAGALLLLQGAQDAQAAAPLNAGEWITHDDYPPAALRRDEQGAVGFDLSVDADGRVAKCVVTESSRSTVLDETTCQLIGARARFRPAQDASGTPVPAHFRSRVRWALPEPERVAIADWHAVGVMKVAADGRVVSCEDSSTGIVPETIGKPCDDLHDQLPDGMLQMIGGKGARLVTFETAMSFDGSPEPALHYRKAGQVGSALTRVRFDVNESGAIENCTIIPTGEEGWMRMLPGACSRIGVSFTPRFTPDGKPLRSSGAMVVAISRQP